MTIVIPSSWRDSKCQSILLPPKNGIPYREADIIVQSQHPVYQNESFTLQSEGCGHSGDLISLPFDLIINYNYSKATSMKRFVKEWAKYRYGIFDETGFAGDKMYPHFFYENGQILPTGTSNVLLGGVWKSESTNQAGCDPSQDSNCHFYPNEKQTREMTCSLSGFEFLPNVTKFCDSKEIAISGPTKHNILCQGKSALEVIESHADFTRYHQHSSETRTPKNRETKFEIVREPLEQQYVLVIETSQSMDKKGAWKWINKAAQKFIRYDLPFNSNLAIVTFSNVSKVEHAMVQVHSDQIRARLADTIPDKYHLSKSSKKCVLCALQNVIDLVGLSSQAGTNIVLLTEDHSNTFSNANMDIIKDQIIQMNIKLNAIVMPKKKSLNDNAQSSMYDEWTGLTGGRAYVIHNHNSPLDFFVRLNEAFADVLKKDAIMPSEVPEIVHQETLSHRSRLSTGNFAIDSTLGGDTLFGIYVEDEEDHLIKSITFKDSKGKTYGPFLRMSSDFDLVNFKTINFPAGQTPPFGDVSSHIFCNCLTSFCCN